MSKNTLLSELINYVSANSLGNVTIAAPTSGLALDVNGTGRYTSSLTASSFVKSGGTSSQYLMADGSVSTGPSITGYVPYTGATGAVNLGAYDLTVNGIKVGKGGGAVYDNTVLGNSALTSNISGSSNVAIGYYSLNTNTIAGANTAVGVYALSSNISGGTNTAIGYSAGSSITTGSNNVIIGGYAGTSAMANNVVLSDGGGNIRFQYNGTNTLLGQSGNVGIGTTSPTDYSGYTTLHINGKSGTGSGVIRVTNFNGTAGFNMYADNAATFNTTSAIPILFLTQDTERMRITSSGNVGIGTTSPSAKLDIAGGDLYLRTGGALYANTLAPYSGNMTISLGGSGNNLIVSGGNVGIGTSSPLSLLHVAGNILSQGLRLNISTANQGHRFYSRTMDVSAYTTQTNMRFAVAAGNNVQFQYEIVFHATRLSGTLAEIWYLRYTAGIAYDTAGNPNERWWDLREQAGNGIAGVGRSNNGGYFDITNSAFDTSCRLTCVVKITCNNWDAVTVTFP